MRRLTKAEVTSPEVIASAVAAVIAVGRDNTVNVSCPRCGGILELVKGSEGGRIDIPGIDPYGKLTRITRVATFWACTGCEHCEEK